MEASSEADMVLDQVLQWQNLSGIPLGVAGSTWRLVVVMWGREWEVLLEYFSSHFPSHYAFDLTLEIEFYLALIFSRSHSLVWLGQEVGWDWIECLSTPELLCPSLLTCSPIYTYCPVIILGDTCLF